MEAGHSYIPSLALIDERTFRDWQRVLSEWECYAENRVSLSESLESAKGPQYEWLSDREHAAQQIIDLLQLALDAQEDGPAYHRLNHKKYFGILRYLSRLFQLLPTKLIAHQVKRVGLNAVAGGGFSDIWRGTLEGKPVCLKVLRFAVEQDVKTRNEVRKQFCHEALIWQQLKHPNILPFLGVNMEIFSPSFCLVSPWMESRDIVTFMKEHPQHDLPSVVFEIAAGLRYLHSRDPPLIHGDLRGGNVLVDDEGHCRLADFGLTLVTSTSQTWSITSTSSAKGTLRWLAPEYITLEEPIPNHTSRDIYAFGFTVFEILTQKPPFDHLNDASVLLSLMAQRRPSKPQNVWCPDSIWAVISQCWAQNARDRPSADRLCSLLKNSLELQCCPCHDLIGCNDTVASSQSRLVTTSPPFIKEADHEMSYHRTSQNSEDQPFVLAESLQDPDSLFPTASNTTHNNVDLITLDYQSGDILQKSQIKPKPPLRAVMDSAHIDPSYGLEFSNASKVVWPAHLDAAMLEGLALYQPDNSRRTLLLGRFPMRNRFISEHILRATGEARTAKQVESRLQQLRDRCGGGKKLQKLLSPVVIYNTNPSNRSNYPRRYDSSMPNSPASGSSLTPVSPLSMEDAEYPPPSSPTLDNRSIIPSFTTAYNSGSVTEDVFRDVVNRRKNWKTLKGGQIVWPLHLEAALLEGLALYQPDNSRETLLLGRFPMRNKFISEHIFRTTGEVRTAKQVGSRLQQLRDRCGGGKKLQKLLSPVVTSDMNPSNRPNYRRNDSTRSPSLSAYLASGSIGFSCGSGISDSAPSQLWKSSSLSASANSSPSSGYLASASQSPSDYDSSRCSPNCDGGFFISEWVDTRPESDLYDFSPRNIFEGELQQVNHIHKGIFQSKISSDKVLAASRRRRLDKSAAKLHTCSICDATFTARHNLTNHLNSHFERKPYICSTCGSSFGTSYVLRRHQKTVYKVMYENNED